MKNSSDVSKRRRLDAGIENIMKIEDDEPEVFEIAHIEEIEEQESDENYEESKDDQQYTFVYAQSVDESPLKRIDTGKRRY